MTYLFDIFYYALLGISVTIFFAGLFIYVPSTWVRMKESSDWMLAQQTTPRNIVFLSYRSIDEIHGQKVRDLLTSHGFIVRMWNPNRPFEDPVRTITDFIEEASAVVVLNPNNASKWVDGERELASKMWKGLVEVQSDSDFSELIDLVRREVEKGRPYSLVPWRRHEVYREALWLKADDASWSKAHIPWEDHVGEETSPSGWLGIFCLCISEVFILLALFVRWMGKIISHEATLTLESFLWGALDIFVVSFFGLFVWFGSVFIINWILIRIGLIEYN
jgi:hypothetical protein